MDFPRYQSNLIESKSSEASFCYCNKWLRLLAYTKQRFILFQALESTPLIWDCGMTGRGW